MRTFFMNYINVQEYIDEENSKAENLNKPGRRRSIASNVPNKKQRRSTSVNHECNRLKNIQCVSK